MRGKNTRKLNSYFRVDREIYEYKPMSEKK